MIHTLQVHPSLSPAELKKLARRYAMTGGFELELAPNLTNHDLLQLVEIYRPLAIQGLGEGMKSRTSNAYRILRLVLEYPTLESGEKERLESELEEWNEPPLL